MKFRNVWITLILVGILTLALTACGAPKVEWTLEVSGGSTPLALSYAELTKMEQLDLGDVLMQKSLGEDEVDSWSGVPIAEIFKQAGVESYSSVTATAGDGYAIEITADEMEGAIVALKKNGDWITKAEADKGPIRLVCPETPANRWVFQLQKLQVNP
ncbi:MAG: molybdopterin-dependent oxidoreductase [Anaerolineae bacterium]|jgi:DMSO/TMAO reductase YedYZ molybdopterin-dependent catalytic subunit|nr:molybdopterin-dependent oxidoreductase [Anaerolineae bacterium]